MSADRYAALATRLLKGARRSSALELGDRAGGVAAVERALRTRVRRHRLARGLVVGAAASLVLAAGFTLLPWPAQIHQGRQASIPPTSPVTPITAALGPGTGTSVLRAGARAALVSGARLEVGDQLRAGRDGAQVALSTGTHFFVGPEGRLDLIALGPRGRLALRAGRVRADVSKLAAGERLVLETADAEVEVKGTSFEVAIVSQAGCPGGSTTGVEVFEGLVQVRTGPAQARETVWLRPGATWVHACAAPAEPKRAAPASGPSISPGTRRSAPRLPPSPATGPVGSTLAAENDLFQAALLAERTGDVAAALRHFDELLVRFPHGSLAGAAREQRLRLARRPTAPPEAR